MPALYGIQEYLDAKIQLLSQSQKNIKKAMVNTFPPLHIPVLICPVCVLKLLLRHPQNPRSKHFFVPLSALL
jgi:hypothetical protein